MSDDVFSESGQGFGGQNSRFVDFDGMTFGGPSEHPGAIRTVHDGALSFLHDVEGGLDALIPLDVNLPADVQAGLRDPAAPVDTRLAKLPGAPKGRANRVTVKGTNNAGGATRVLTVDEKRRAFTLYNWEGDNAAGTIFLAYTEAEALQGNGFPIPRTASITREYTGEVWLSTDSAVDVIARLLSESDE